MTCTVRRAGEGVADSRRPLIKGQGADKGYWHAALREELCLQRRYSQHTSAPDACRPNEFLLFGVDAAGPPSHPRPPAATSGVHALAVLHEARP